MRRRDFAGKIALAHCAGLIGLVIIGAAMRGDWNVDANITLFVIGLFMSAFVFLPVLAVTLSNLQFVLRHRVAFVLLGPIAMTALALVVFGLDESKGIALHTALSSLVLYPMLQRDKVQESQAA